MSTSRVHFETQGHIAYVTLNRPDKLNGLDMAMIKGLIAAAKKVQANREIRAVVLCGAGESFCAGLDFKAVAKDKWMAPTLFLKWPWTRTNLAQRVADCWRRLSVPVICVVHGNCFGGGMQIALGCDFRIAAPTANFSIMEMKWGLIPDMSGTIALSRLTRLDIAQELTMTGKQFSAQQALEWGLISKISEHPIDAANTLAAEMYAQSPDAVAATKKLFQKTWHSNESWALRWERWIQARLLGRKNNRIAIANGLSGDKTKARPFNNRRSF